MSWARKMAERKKVHQVLVRCKNVRHQDKRTKVMARELQKELKHV